ncbi:PLP-dependent aminotransferase family protein [Limnobacter humi]|uniref:PLP-dependent aminotransferase family protein n=1 Tax=Limnobacter humi TaxID=1778671 RepID=A0ABT1WDC4_9BURK|nr:PLP-dependent aminotransferase family protein [Limnobacter humi]MCQ8895041.1 PLP-dependent aminotransferase family protein [Limnobacter humi]
MLLYEDLAHQLTGLIHDGVMRPGDRLPSVRQLAQQQKLSISTVMQALRSLETHGLVEVRPQSGFYVRGKAQRVVNYQPVNDIPEAVDVDLSARLMRVLHLNQTPGIVQMGSAIPAPALLLAPRLNTLYSRIARTQPGLLATGSHDNISEPVLVNTLVRRYLEWGCTVRPEQVVVTNSCTEALMLCLRTVTRQGDTVAVESPTYYVMLQLLEAMGLKALEIPTHPQTGVSVEALELATRDGGVAACLFIPNGSNPLGCVMPDANKQAVARLLAERNIPLIEDDLYGDLCNTPERPRPIYAFDRSGNTMLCSSFSKTVSPALRIGFVAGGKRARQVLFQKTVNSGKTNVMTQRVLAALMDSRGFDAHLRTLRRRLTEQVARTRDAVTRHFPADTRVTNPQGGFVLWIELPDDIDTVKLHGKAIEQGIATVPGPLFSASGRYRNFLRLACGQPWSDATDHAVARLAQLIEAMPARSRKG